MLRRHGLILASLAAGACLIAGAGPLAAQGLPPPGGGSGGKFGIDFLHGLDATRIADPKLDGGQVVIRYALDKARYAYAVTITIRDVNGAIVGVPFSGFEKGGIVQRHVWDGRDANGAWCDPGRYVIEVAALDSRQRRQTEEFDCNLVRLGIKQIECRAVGAANEWQTVYFLKRGAYKFYATPATGEWLSTRESTELADLDLDNADPRPAPAIWNATDEAVMEQNSSGVWVYENDAYNYPLCYRVGATPEFVVKFGTQSVRADGSVGGCGYPVVGYDLRVVGESPNGSWVGSNTAIAPNGTDTLVGPAVSGNGGRVDRKIAWRFEYRPIGGTAWSPVPGSFKTEHRIYTILDQPYWNPNGNGTQYTGPWVEVLDYLCDYADEFGLSLATPDEVVEAMIKGCFGQSGNLATAIEDVHYDCPSEGGDGGSTHYGGTTTVHLSHLLNNHDDGIYVNCTDCATTTSVMLAMLGTDDMELVRLGSMTLRAIWGIGCDDYTLDLWSGSHGFSYHHIITRDGATNISDACLCVDEDGDPDTLGGTPGYNHDRDWDNYESLLATGNVTKQLEKIPKVD